MSSKKILNRLFLGASILLACEEGCIYSAHATLSPIAQKALLVNFKTVMGREANSAESKKLFEEAERQRPQGTPAITALITQTFKSTPPAPTATVVKVAAQPMPQPVVKVAAQPMPQPAPKPVVVAHTAAVSQPVVKVAAQPMPAAEVHKPGTALVAVSAERRVENVQGLSPQHAAHALVDHVARTGDLPVIPVPVVRDAAHGQMLVGHYHEMLMHMLEMLQHHRRSMLALAQKIMRVEDQKMRAELLQHIEGEMIAADRVEKGMRPVLEHVAPKVVPLIAEIREEDQALVVAAVGAAARRGGPPAPPMHVGDAPAVRRGGPTPPPPPSDLMKPAEGRAEKLERIVGKRVAEAEGGKDPMAELVTAIKGGKVLRKVGETGKPADATEESERDKTLAKIRAGVKLRKAPTKAAPSSQPKKLTPLEEHLAKMRKAVAGTKPGTADTDPDSENEWDD